MAKLLLKTPKFPEYRISANSFRGNYSFLNLVLFTVTFDLYFINLNSCRGNYSREETIQGRKLFAEIRYTFVRMPNMKLKYLIDSIQGPLLYFTQHHTKSILIPSKIPSKRQVYVTPRFPRRHNEAKKILRFHQNLFLYQFTILRHTKGQLILKASFLVLI